MAVNAYKKISVEHLFTDSLRFYIKLPSYRVEKDYRFRFLKSMFDDSTFFKRNLVIINVILKLISFL